MNPAALTKARLSAQIESGFPIIIGRHTYGPIKLHWDKGDFSHTLRIGSFCSIAEEVNIFVGRHGRHSVDCVSTYPMTMIFPRSNSASPSKYSTGDLSVNIGHDVWIGRGVTIMAGITIGHGAVIGARSVVTKDIEPYAIVGGVPGKKIRDRFDPRIIEKLLKLNWWDWDDDTISQRMDLFCTPNFEATLDKYLDS